MTFLEEAPKVLAVLTPVAVGFAALIKWALSEANARAAVNRAHASSREDSLTGREQELSKILIAQLKTQSEQLTDLRDKLNEVGVSADNAYDAANHAKAKLEDLREEGLESNKVIAEKQKKKDEYTDAKLESIQKTGCDTHDVAIAIDKKIEVPKK